MFGCVIAAADFASLKEALLGLVVVEQVGGEELQRDRSARESCPPACPHLTHAAGAEALDDLVARDGLTDHDAMILAPRRPLLYTAERRPRRVWG